MIDTLTAAEFARRFTMRSGQLAWLLGAGASASAGIPTAGHMIDDFKAMLFAQAHGLSRDEIDLDDPLWTSRVNSYFNNAHGFPIAGDPREYEVAFESAYPEARDRRTYIDRAVERGVPSYGHRVLGALTTGGQIPVIFTPNFDAMIEQAAISVADSIERGNDRQVLAVSALTNADVAVRCVAESDWPLLVKLHGDYQSTDLKNTTSELQGQDERLRAAMTECLRRFGLVVVGYSGRDASVMEALHAALKARTPYQGGLFWVQRTGSELLPEVASLLAAAASQEVPTSIVACDTFDELMGELARHIKLAEPLLATIAVPTSLTDVIDVALPTVRAAQFPALRFNALPLQAWPAVARVVDASVEMDDLRAALKRTRAKVDAVSHGSKVMAFGHDEDLRAALGDAAAELSETSLDIGSDTVAHGLVYQSLTRAMTRGRPLRFQLRTRGHMLMIRQPRTDDEPKRKDRDASALEELASVYSGDLYGTVPGAGVPYAEAVNLRLERRLDRWWVLFEPTTWVRRNREDHSEKDVVVAWLRERWFNRRNREWAAMVDAWAHLLAPESPTEARAFWLDQGGIDACFTLGGTTAWAPPGQAGLR